MCPIISTVAHWPQAHTHTYFWPNFLCWTVSKYSLSCEETLLIPIVMTSTETHWCHSQIPSCLLEDFAIIIEFWSVFCADQPSCYQLACRFRNPSNEGSLADATKDCRIAPGKPFQRPFWALLQLVTTVAGTCAIFSSHRIGCEHKLGKSIYLNLIVAIKKYWGEFWRLYISHLVSHIGKVCQHQQ